MNLVFFDIDGTLARGVEIPKSAKEGIRKLRENGNLVWVCTGRILRYAKKYFHQVANGYIVCNGREGYTCCAKVFEVPLKNEEIEEIVRRLERVDAGYTFYGVDGGKYFGPEEGYEVLAGIYDEGMVKKGGTLKKEFSFDIWYRDRDHLEKIIEVLKDIAIINPHGPHPSADATMIGFDKADAIRRIAEYMNVPMENVYVFGDGMNDISMLKAAGHGIAMGNAPDEVKAAADYVTTSIDEDGVWNGLKHFGLIQE